MLYEDNETMRRIGQECAIDYLNKDTIREISDVVETHIDHKSNVYSLATDVFILGYLHGKGVEKCAI